MWKDVLENPLDEVRAPDPVTGHTIHWGSTVSGFHGLCWTHRAKATADDWADFTHGKESVRITATVGKLLDRVMCPADRAYMHRAWLVMVDYVEPDAIRAMQNVEEVSRRMESTGAMLALSAATVRTKYIDEDEVRLLFDPSVRPHEPSHTFSQDGALLHIPFDWAGFIDHQEAYP